MFEFYNKGCKYFDSLEKLDVWDTVTMVFGGTKLLFIYLFFSYYKSHVIFIYNALELIIDSLAHTLFDAMIWSSTKD